MMSLNPKAEVERGHTDDLGLEIVAKANSQTENRGVK